jgi:hypothetical protein
MLRKVRQPRYRLAFSQCEGLLPSRFRAYAE